MTDVVDLNARRRKKNRLDCEPFASASFGTILRAIGMALEEQYPHGDRAVFGSRLTVTVDFAQGRITLSPDMPKAS